MPKTLEKINQSIWELKQKLELDPEDPGLRRDLLRFFHESRVYSERREGVAEDDRSALLLQERDAVACLLLHGAGGSPAEMHLLAEHLFSQGYTVYSMRLPIDPRMADSGIGDFIRGKIRSKEVVRNGGRKTSKTVGWSVCLAEAEVVLDTLFSYSRSVYLVGFSFGATIALNLLSEFPVKGTILISPALFPVRSGRYILFRSWKKILPSVAKEIAPVRSTIMDLIDRTRSQISRIEEPMLVIQAGDDPVVSPRGFHFLRRHATNSRSKFIMIEKGGHVLVNGEQSPKVFDICSRFIRKI